MKRLLVASLFLLAAAELPVALGKPEFHRAAAPSAGSDLYAEGEANGFGTKNYAGDDTNGLGAKTYAEGENNGFGAKNFAMAAPEGPMLHAGPFVLDQWLD